MSWTRTNFDDQLFLKIPFTSGYYARDTSEANYGPYEQEVIDSGQDTREGYIIPRLKWMADNGKITLKTFDETATAGGYQKMLTQIFMVAPPQLNDHGYYCATWTGENRYKALWKIGYQQHIYSYNTSDDFFGTVQFGPDGDLYHTKAGLDIEMEEFADFYKNGGYSNSPFMTIYNSYMDAATKTEEGTAAGTQIIQVPYSARLETLNFSYNWVHNVDSFDSVIRPAEDIIFTDAQNMMKSIPFISLDDNSAMDSVPSMFNMSYLYYSSTYPEWTTDMKNRWKYQELIDTQTAEYVAKKIDDIASMLDTVLSMPKEFRVRMQPSTPYDLNKISTMIEGGTAITTFTPDGLTAGSATGGGGSMGGSSY